MKCANFAGLKQRRTKRGCKRALSPSRWPKSFPMGSVEIKT